MKLNIAEDKTVITSNVQSAHTFQIAMNAKAFRTLSDSLYMNKIGSIVREISCNALDSHIAAGIPNEPFEIHVPDSFEPWFSVQDFGVGLSHDDIVNVYTTLFKSTKDQSNDQIGAFGLGSKTPFSYTDSFTVTSVKDGFKNYYNALIDENGIPTVVQFAQEETTERNGVKVEIAVKREDYSTFRSEVATQLRFLAVKPVITNGSVRFDETLDASNPQLLVNTQNVRVHDFRANESNYGSSNGAGYAVIGPVGYPIQTSNIKGFKREYNELLSILEGKVAFLFNIGEIEVTASREGISYTDKTCKAILQKFEVARAEILDVIQKEVNFTNSGTSWEMACQANKFHKLTKLFINAGMTIPTATVNGDEFAFDVHLAQVCDANNKRDFFLNTYKVPKGCSTFRRDLKDQKYVTASEKVRFFVRDTDKKPVARLKEYYSQHPFHQIYVFERSFENVFSDVEIAEFSRACGGVEIVRVSTLPEPVRAPVDRSDVVLTARGGVKHPTAYLINPKHFDDADGRRLDAPFGTKIYDDFEEIEPAYFIGSERGIVQSERMYDTGSGYSLNELQMLEKIARMYGVMGKQMPEIYVFNAKRIEKVAAAEGWTHVNEFIVKALDEIRALAPRIERVRTTEIVRAKVKGFFDDDYMDILIRPNFFKKLDRKSVGTWPIRVHRFLKDKWEGDDITNMACREFNGFYKEKIDAMVAKVEKKIEVARARLPLLQHLPSFYSYRSTNAEMLAAHTLQYINMMGNTEALDMSEKTEDENAAELLAA